MPRVKKKKQPPRKAAKSVPHPQRDVTTLAATSSSSSSSRHAKIADRQGNDKQINSAATSSSFSKPGPATRSKARDATATAIKQVTKTVPQLAPPRAQQQANSSSSGSSGTNKKQTTAASNTRTAPATSSSSRKQPYTTRQAAASEDEDEGGEENESNSADAPSSSEAEEMEEEDRSNFGFPLFGPNSAIDTCLRKIKELEELSRRNKAASTARKEQGVGPSSTNQASHSSAQPIKKTPAGKGDKSTATTQPGRQIKTEKGQQSSGPSKHQTGRNERRASGSEKDIKKGEQHGVRIKKEDEDESMNSDADVDDGQLAASDAASSSSDDSRSGTSDLPGAAAEMLRGRVRDAMGMNHDLVNRIRLDTIQRLREQLASTRDLASRYNVTLAQASEDKNWVTTAMRYMRTILVEYQKERRDNGRLTYHQAHVQKMARVGLMELERAVEKDRRWEERRRRSNGARA